MELKIETWNTGRHYTEKGQRMAAAVLPSGRVMFWDGDRGINGVTKEAKPDSMSVRAFTMNAYDYNEYGGIHHIPDMAIEDVYAARDQLMKAAAQVAGYEEEKR